ncbi:MAG: hypothetical protein B6U89_02075 [Desulfurococcales archaeon ex4484_58]|nr:MAG: hypothetical protein B6U89_02075 [Desulfurococcales archaeon ex4484_58]
MKPKELLMKASNTLSIVSNRIESKVLNQSTKLKPEIISISSRLNELITYINGILRSISERIGDETDVDSVVDFGKYFYIVFHKDRFVLIRNKPKYIIISYDSGKDEIHVKSRKLSVKISTASLEASLLTIKVSIDPGNIEDYINKFNELRYIMKSFGKIIEYYMLPLTEKRLRASIK